MSKGTIRPLNASSQRDEHPVHTLRDDASRLGRRLRDEIEAQPMFAVVAAACVGFALGGGVSRGALTVLLGVGVRAAGSRLGEAIIERAPRFQAAQEASR
jgi:hypothetical protein